MPTKCNELPYYDNRTRNYLRTSSKRSRRLKARAKDVQKRVNRVRRRMGGLNDGGGGIKSTRASKRELETKDNRWNKHGGQSLSKALVQNLKRIETKCKRVSRGMQQIYRSGKRNGRDKILKQREKRIRAKMDPWNDLPSICFRKIK